MTETSAIHDGGEAIIEAFRSLGVDYVMSSPGSELSPVWEAFARQRLTNSAGPKLIESWHELTAVDMAIGYTQFTGRMQAVLLHAGVGLLQGAMAIHAARNFEIPMLVMSGESATYGEDPAIDPGWQWHDHLGLIGGARRFAEPITKWAVQVGSIHTLYEQLVRAGEMSQRNPQAPVYLSIAFEELLKPWPVQSNVRPAPSPPKTRPLQTDIDKVVDALTRARRPIVVTDSAGRSPEAFNALVQFAETFVIPVMEGRVAGYANFPKSNALYWGPYDESELSSSDLILLINARAPWYPSNKRPKNATVVAVSENPLKLQFPHQNIGADFYIEGDLASTIELFVKAHRPRVEQVDLSRRADIQSHHKRLRAKSEDAEAKAKERQGIDPIALAAALRQVMPHNAIFVDETIIHSGALKRHLQWDAPQSYFVVGGGLGQGTGIALGIKLAAPERPVVLLVGDGSFLYNPITPALGASRIHNLPILIVVCNNHKYGAMEYSHKQYYPQGLAVEKGIWHGVEIDGPAYSQLGAPFNFHGQEINTTSELVGGLASGLSSVSSGTTSIVDVRLSW